MIKKVWADLTPVPMYCSARAGLIALSFAGLMFLPVWYYRVPILFPYHSAAVLFLFGELAFLLVIRNKPWRDTAGAWTFIAAMLAIQVACALSNEQYIRDNLRAEPFVGAKILAVFIPLFAPPRKWVAWTAFTCLALGPVIHYYTWDLSERAELGIQEPWVTAVFVFIAAIAYELRIRVAETNLHTKILAEKQALMERIASLLLGARHLMNTPLQTIEAVVSVLETREPALFERTEKSFSTIRRTSDILTFAESFLQWDTLDLPGDTDELEFRARQVRSAASQVGLSE